MKGRKMTTRENWMLDTLADVRRALDAVLASAEDLYKACSGAAALAC